MTSSVKSIIKICITSGVSCTPYNPFSATSSANSLMKNENNVGDKTPPCLTPLGQSKKSVRLSGHHTHDFTILYRLCKICKMFPPSPAFLKTFYCTCTFPDFFSSGTSELLHTKQTHYPWLNIRYENHFALQHSCFELSTRTVAYLKRE